jgi:hypothetical protein
MLTSRLKWITALVAAAVLQAAAPAWVARSNENAQVLLDPIARFAPEAAGSLGVNGLDEHILDLKPGIRERAIKAFDEAIHTLEGRLASEKDPLVRQDLEILLASARQNRHAGELRRKLLIPYFDLNQTVYSGVQALLDDQIAESRRPAALVRLKRYAGVEEGYQPIVDLAEARIRELSKPGLLGPPKAQVEKDLSNAKFFVNGIGLLFEKYKIKGYQEPYAKLKEQLAGYETFIKTEILPKARTDFRLPPELYALQMEQFGIDIPPTELAAKAHAAFTQMQAEMQTIAAQIAKERGWASPDYRDVIRQLKKDQLVGEAILPHYLKRLAQIEEIVRREHLATLPDRPARIRLASAAESAQIPAPNMQAPRLINNQGEKGEFLLPLNAPSDSGKMERFDDFTFDAASWTLTAHEARPGHEMQFDAMVERGVSIARAVFAFNSTNVEGWGLYAEWITKPYMPLDGQLISLQYRLMRAARAFLDPELHMGKVTPEEALRILKEDVVLSNPFAKQEVERYTFRSPGQACSYFYGYTRLLELRTEVEKRMGPSFNAQRFHDFILSQGLLPPALLRKAVLDEFAGKA